MVFFHNSSNLLFQKKAVVGGFANNYYWSSTEFNYNEAWVKDFADGSQDVTSKANTFYVRAIRAF